MVHVLARTVGLSACLGAVALLYGSSRAEVSYRRVLVVLGWALLAIALILLSFEFGLVRGSTFALLAFSLCGYSAVALAVKRRRPSGRQSRQVLAQAERPKRGRALQRGLTASLLTTVVSLALGAAVAGLPLGAPVDRVTLSALVLPLVWASLVVWAVSDGSLRRPLIGMSGALAGSGIAIALELLS
jgi:hypothetical protein